MAIDFPSSPTVNDLFAADDKLWQWDGVAWTAYLAANAASIHGQSHGSAGVDPVTLAQSQVTGLTTSLSGKASTTHASTHASGGSDVVTLAQSQVTNLTTDLAAKSPLASPIFSGNVGIGGTPSFPLDVISSSQSADVAQIRAYSEAAPTGTSSTTLRLEKGSGYGADISGYLTQGVGSGLLISTRNGGVSTERMRINSAGNVGIGTSSPSSRLHVHGSGITLTDGNNGLSMFQSNYSVGHNMIGPNGTHTSWAVYTPSGVGMGVAVNEAASTVELYARNNGTQMYSNGQLRFNPGGQITMANQPVFWAGRSSGDVTGPAVIPFNDVRFNRGSNYSTATGRFTAPVYGIYCFDASVMWNNVEPKAIIRLNDGHMVYDYQESHSSYAGWWHNNLHLVTVMAAGDYVDVYNYGTGPAYGTASVHTWFSGFLLG